MKTVKVHSLDGHALAVTADDGRHELISDEPVEGGGEDLGPSPYELLLSSLGACKVITLFLYARRKEWPLEAVSVELSHEKVHARDCADCTQEEIDAAGPTGRIDVIHSKVSVKGKLDAEQVARLLEIADRCPVHRTLQTPPKIISAISLQEVAPSTS